MLKRIKLLVLLFAYACGVHAATTWQQLAPGLSYTTISVGRGFRRGKLHAFKVDLRQYKLDISLAKDNGHLFAHVFSLTSSKDALIGINGGFFTPQMQPLGLRVSNGKILNRLKRTSWWGVFQVKNTTPKVTSLKQFQFNHDIDFAIQSGPRLIVNGTIPTLKGGVDNRSALGITKDKKVIIVATENQPMTTTELAELMRLPGKDDGLDCVDALNLDGGSSTQLFANVNDFYLSVPSFAPVTDAVVLLRR